MVATGQDALGKCRFPAYWMVVILLAHLFWISALAGSGLLLWAAWLMRRCVDNETEAARCISPAISLLKPLHGAEPKLFENLATAIEQDYGGPVEMICGVADADDPAITTVKRLCEQYPRADIRLVINPRCWGSNAKVSNLINMVAHARYDMIVVADSDMAAPRDYLTRVVVPLDRPVVGAVTCLYVGRGDAGFWSRLTARGIGWHFLPATLIGLATGLGHPCMGSTIAFRREMLDAIGGFAAFADTLADDHAIGAAIRARGYQIVVPDMVLTHGCAEASFVALRRQELRWNATIAGIDPLGYAGSAILHPLGLAVIAALFGGGIGVIALAWAARGAIAVQTSRIARTRSSPIATLGAILLIPVRDLLSFGLFLASFTVRSVDWRGTVIKIGRKGQLSPGKDIRS